jgi:hypothetical protein
MPGSETLIEFPRNSKGWAVVLKNNQFKKQNLIIY